MVISHDSFYEILSRSLRFLIAAFNAIDADNELIPFVRLSDTVQAPFVEWFRRIVSLNPRLHNVQVYYSLGFMK